jgi:hypothetical protein
MYILTMDLILLTMTDKGGTRPFVREGAPYELSKKNEYLVKGVRKKTDRLTDR